MGLHCPTCSCSQCKVSENRWEEARGEVTYIDSNGNRIRDGEIVGHQSDRSRTHDQYGNPRTEETIWRKGEPNYPGSWEGSQVISHVTRQPNTDPNGVGYKQTHYADRSLPPQNIRGFQQTYHRDPNQQWERMPDSPLTHEQQRQVNRQMHGLAEDLGRQYGAQNVQVHQAFIQPHQLTPAQIRQLPPAQQEQIRQYQQQPKQGFWNRLRGVNQEVDTVPTQQQSQLVRSHSQSLPEQIINLAKKAKRKSAVGGLVLADGTVTLERNLTPKNPASFRFKWRDKAAVGFWHIHQEEEGHPNQMGQDDIRVAQESGLSCYMVFQGKGNDYRFAEYHPKGTPTTRPRNSYDLCLDCPINISKIEEVIEESNAHIKEENARYRNEVNKAYQEAQKAQQQTLRDVSHAALATQNLQDKSQLFANKYQMIGARNNVNLEQAICRQPVQVPRVQGVQQPRPSKAIAGSSTGTAGNCEVNFQRHRARHKDFAE